MSSPTPLPSSQRPWFVRTTPGPVIYQSSDLPGWEEKVPDGDRRSAACRIFRDGRDRLDPSDVPDVVRLLTRPKRRPDGFIVMNYIHVVTGAVRDTIEALDPGRHQFVPLAVVEKDGTPAGGEWFALNVMHRQDTLIPERSNAPMNGLFPEGTSYTPISDDGIALDLAKLDDSHLWREQRLRHGSALFMSHALREALKANGLRVFRQIRTRKVEPAH